MAWQRLRNQLAHQETCDRSIAVREVEYVWLAATPAFAFDRVFETRHAAAIGIAQYVDRRHFVHAHAPVTHSPALVHFQHLVIDLDVVLEVGPVAHLAEQCDLLVAAHAGQVIHLRRESAHEVGFGPVAHRRICNKFLPRTAAVATNQLALAIRLAVIGNGIRQIHGVVEILVVIIVEALDVDADVLEQVLRHIGVPGRGIDGLGAAVADSCLAVNLELVALGMSAEVVVIIENEHARTGIFLPEEVRRG